MADWLKRILELSLAPLVLGFPLFFFTVIIPAFTTGEFDFTLIGRDLLVNAPVPTIAVLLIAISSLLFNISILMACYETAKSANEPKWKLKWIAALLILGVIGMALYLAFGRKKLKAARKRASRADRGKFVFA